MVAKKPSTTGEQKDDIQQTIEVSQEKDIAKTVEFFLWENPWEAKWVIEEIHQKLCFAINKSSNDQLSESIFIKTDYSDKCNNITMANYAWIKKAFDLMVQNPEKKIVLVDIVAKSLDDYANFKELSYMYEKNKDIIQLINQSPNVKFLHYSSCDFLNAFKLNKFFKENYAPNAIYHAMLHEKISTTTGEEWEKNMENIIKMRWFDLQETVQQMSFEENRMKLVNAILKYEDPKKIANEAYLKTITFKFGQDDDDKEYEHIIRTELEGIDLKKLQNSTFIFLEWMMKEEWLLQNFESMDMALDTLLEDSDQKMVLFTVFDPKNLDNMMLGDNKEKLRLLQNRPNIRIFKIGDNIKKLETIFDMPDYLSTVTFKLGIHETKELVESWKDNLRGIKNPEIIKDLMVVQIFAAFKDGQHLQEGNGLDMIREEIQKNPERKILAYSPMTPENLESVMEKRNKWDMLTYLKNQKNIKFFETPFEIEDIEKAFSPAEDAAEINEGILDTLQFYDSRWRIPYLKDFFKTLDLKTLNLENSIVVDLRVDGETWEDMDWLKAAYETFQKHPDSKIVLCSLIPIDIFQKVLEKKETGKYLDELLKGKNVRLIQSSWWNSMTEEEVRNQFDGMYQDIETSASDNSAETFKELSETKVEESFQKILVSEISHFMHDAGHRTGDKKEIYNLPYEERLKYYFDQPYQEKSKERIAFEDKLIALLQLQHPSYRKVTRERNLWGIVDTYKFYMKEVLPEWTYFSGVYVDRDDCRFDNQKKQFNQAVTDKIKYYEGQWKEIIPRTLGNLEIKQKEIDDAGFPYKIKNKIDFKWAMVEIAIDNEEEKKLYANARVKAKTFVKI